MSKVLNFSIEGQLCSEWCWAAVAAAVCRCFGDQNPPRQCDIVNRALNLPTDACSECDCENDPLAPCNKPHNLADSLDVVGHNRGNPPNGDPTTRFTDVKREIDAGSPIVVQVTLDDPAASDHALAIYGYSDDGAVNIADPMHPGSMLSVVFDDFAKPNGSPVDLGGGLHGSWEAAYFTSA